MPNKKKLDKEHDKLITLGEGTVEEARSILSQEEKEAEAKRDEVLNFIDSKKNILDYHPLLAEILITRLNYNEWNGWTYKVAPTKEGVVMELYSPDKRIFRSAFKPVRGPMDLTAIDIFAQRAQNTVDEQTTNGSKANGVGKV